MCNLELSTKRIKQLSEMVLDNEVFDEITGHKLTADGEEMKFCFKCNEWKPLSHFGKNSNEIDNLQTVCKQCVNDGYRLRRNRHRASKSESNVLQSKANCAPKNDEKSDEEPNYENALKQLELLCIYVKSLRESVETLSREKAEWEKKYNDYKSAVENGYIAVRQSITEKEVVEYINSHRLPPRVYFNAIAKFDSRYVFSCMDKDTGTTTEIVYKAS